MTQGFHTVCECNERLGCKTLHPQASLIDLSKVGEETDAVRFDFYAVLLIEECPDCCCCCGRKYYDYTTATMVFLKPSEVFRLSSEGALPRKGWLLAFHPDLLYKTTLCTHIENYSFFSYRKEEALHLSQRETATVTCCLENIEAELHHEIDCHSATILSRHIELLLDYCARFYERQFITREERNKDLLQRVDGLLDEHIASPQLLPAGIMPELEMLAEELGLSAAYLSDLLHHTVGQSLNDYFLGRRLYTARRLLQSSNTSARVVASRLGFPTVQQFTTLFRRIIGLSPSECRHEA